MSIRRFGLISDTHARMHPAVLENFAGVEMILHAGDVVDPSTLTELSAVAPVFAVMGNCDTTGQPDLPLRRTVRMPFGDAGIAHGHLFPARIQDKAEALAAAFPGVRVILTGHSHQFDERSVNETLVINPGSAGPPRLAGESSIAILEWDEDSDALSVKRINLRW